MWGFRDLFSCEFRFEAVYVVFECMGLGRKGISLDLGDLGIWGIRGIVEWG